MMAARRDQVIDRWHLAVMEPNTLCPLAEGPQGGERATTFQ